MKRLALRNDGQLTWCTSPEDKVGQGRCNHVTHIEPGESQEQFLKRIEKISEELNIELKNFALENSAILREHNQKTYHELKNFFESGGKDACIVQATATGKSSIMTAIMEQYNTEPCVFISPKTEINGQFQKHNEFNKVSLNDNLNCITYQKICQSWKRGNFDKDFKYLKENAALICLDEIHHLNNNESRTNKKWKESIDAFIDYVSKEDEKTRVLGATATSGDETAIQYFCNSNKFANIDLSKAINDGILNMPKVYATPGKDVLENNYASLQTTLEKAYENGKISSKFYNEKIGELFQLTNKYYKHSCENKVNTIKEASLDIIKQDEAEGKGTKILVFCNKAEDTQTKMEEYGKIFKELYPDKNIRTSKIISSSKSQSEHEFFNDFQSETPVPKGEIQILTVMDMYSEGVHAPNLSLAIMDRKICDSKSLYYQQIGRVMSSKSPTIIDFSENVNRGYLDWDKLGEECDKKDYINITETKQYSNEITKLELEINNEISPNAFALNRDGEIVKVSKYLKDKYEWTSTVYLNNVKRRIRETGCTIERAAAMEPGFRLKENKVLDPKRKSFKY